MSQSFCNKFNNNLLRNIHKADNMDSYSNTIVGYKHLSIDYTDIASNNSDNNFAHNYNSLD